MTGWLSRGAALFAPPAPTLAFEIAAGRVTGIAVEWDGVVPRVVGAATRPVPEGAITPDGTTTNIHDRPAVTAALGEVGRALPQSPGRICLAVPDTIAKVSFLTLEERPTRPGELEQLIAWRLKKAVPFPVEEAQIAFVGGARQDVEGREGQELVVTLSRREVVEEYEQVCGDAGLHAGVVELTSFALINGVLGLLPPAEGDWLLAHRAHGYTSLASVRGGDLLFYRQRPDATPGDLATTIHQTAMYYQDHVGGPGLSGIILVGTRDDDRASDVASLLSDRFGTTVHGLPEALVASAPTVDLPPVEELAAPLGLLTRPAAVGAATAGGAA